MNGENIKEGNRTLHAPSCVANASKIDGNTDEEVVDFIDRYTTCSLPDPENNSEFYSLVKNASNSQSHKNISSEKRVTCRFGAPWPALETALII